MLSPLPPGKREEELHLDMKLLYTPENGEYCIEEARTKSMGLLRKKWPILPPQPPTHRVSAASSSSSSKGEALNDDPNRTVLPPPRRKSLWAEPTVTITTREALNDVFGLYNSPTKTLKMGLGSKHAPVKQVEAIASTSQTFKPITAVSENAAGMSRTISCRCSHLIPKCVGFQPFVDENANAKRKENRPTQSPVSLVFYEAITITY
jgi:checkpoint serine/threonine-protein kinase